MTENENAQQTRAVGENGGSEAKKSEPEIGSGFRPLVTETERHETEGRDQGASSGQKGQPGIPDPKKEVWSPGSSEPKP